MRRHVWMVLSLLALAATLTMTGEAEAQQRRRMGRPMMVNKTRPAVSVQIVDRMGNQLRVFNHHSQTFVLGTMGQRYAVQIRNNTAKRIEVVLSIDGRDAVSGKRSNPMMNRGYVLAPMGMATIDGFRTSMQTVAAFRFTDPGDSFAGRMGSRMSLGVIKVAVFKEKQRMMKRPMPSRRMKGKKMPSARSRRMAPESGNLGTQFGEERMSRVLQTTFVRDGHGATQLVTLRYDNAAGLRARGVMGGGMRGMRHRRMRHSSDRGAFDRVSKDGGR